MLRSIVAAAILFVGSSATFVAAMTVARAAYVEGVLQAAPALSLVGVCAVAAWVASKCGRSGSLDTKQDDHVVTIQWSPRRGFGVSASALGDGYGEGPDETIESREEATKRVLDLLRTKGHTTPPESVALRQLRGLVGVTQEELADKLGVQQAAVSRLERRDDITLGSLRRFVRALGAHLEINVRTSSGDRVRLANGKDSGR